MQGVDEATTHRLRVVVEPCGAGASRLALTHHYAEGSTDRLREGLAAGWWAYVAALGRTLRRPGDDGAGGWLADFRTAQVVLRQ